MDTTGHNTDSPANDTSKIMADLAAYSRDWEIIADSEGWHAIPLARLAFHGLLHGDEPAQIHSDTAAELLILLRAWTRSEP